MAALKMVDKISDEIDNKSYSLGVFIVISESFDTLDHNNSVDNNNNKNNKNNSVRL